MKPNKLIETLALLNTLEQKRFRNVIKNKRKGSLLPLYELCLSQLEKGQPMPPKEKVYPLLFEEEYTRENDFLLRNRYRLLTDELEDFLRSVNTEKYFPGVADAARLRYMLETGNVGLFKKEFDLLSLKYADDLLFWQAIDPVYLVYFITSSQISIAHFAAIKAVIEACRERLVKLYNRQMSDYEVKWAYAEKVCSVLTDEPIQKKPSQLIKTPHEDALVAYRKLKSASYYVSGNEKIALLLAAEKILQKDTFPGPAAEEMCWLKANTGLEYYLQHDFSNAVLHYDALFASPEIERFSRLPETVLNYLSALMSVEDYKKAVKAPAVFENKIMGFRAVFYKYICLKSLSYLFLGAPRTARKELNRLEDHAEEFDFLYWKITLLLSYAVENRWSETQNELQNLLKTKTIKQNERPDLLNLVEVLKMLIKYGLIKEDGKKATDSFRAQCMRKAEEVVNTPGAFVHPPKLVAKLFREMGEKPL